MDESLEGCQLQKGRAQAAPYLDAMNTSESEDHGSEYQLGFHLAISIHFLLCGIRCTQHALKRFQEDAVDTQ